MTGRAVLISRAGSAKTRWAVETPLGYIIGRTAKDVERRARPLYRWMRRHEWRLT